MACWGGGTCEPGRERAPEAASEPPGAPCLRHSRMGGGGEEVGEGTGEEEEEEVREVIGEEEAREDQGRGVREATKGFRR